MWRLLLFILLLTSLPIMSRAQAEVWQSCRSEHGAPTPVLHDCRPVEGGIDPQGRELWLRAVVRRPAGTSPAALYIVGTASSEVWLNGRKLGANGRPGASSGTEKPGRYEAAFPIPDSLWRPEDNVAVVRMSSFHGSVRLDIPVAGVLVAPYPRPSSTVPLAIIFGVAGVLFAAAFSFGLIHSLRRTGSSLTLAALAGVAGLQAILESLRALVPYAYPVHGLRLLGVWGLTAIFTLLLVFWIVSRFWPQARRPVIAVAVLALGATSVAPGFDLKTGLALMVGLSLSAVAAGVGVRRRLPTARPSLVYLVVFIVIGLLFPAWLIDLSFFLFAAGFLLPLLMAEMVRLGRDDQQREAALTRAVARADCLVVASSRGVERVPLTDVVAVVGADDYVELRLKGGRSLLHAARLDGLEEELPGNFLRVHRSAIANLDHFRAIERHGGGSRLLLEASAPLPVSRKRLALVQATIKGASRPDA